MVALGLDAINDEQVKLQEQCAQIIENLVALEELLDEVPESFPEIEL